VRLVTGLFAFTCYPADVLLTFKRDRHLASFRYLCRNFTFSASAIRRPLELRDVLCLVTVPMLKELIANGSLHPDLLDGIGTDGYDHPILRQYQVDRTGFPAQLRLELEKDGQPFRFPLPEELGGQ
jgi:hypothetical protein